MSHFRIDWIDGGREPQCPPDPLYPDGKDLLLPDEIDPKCRVLLPYPAARIGMYYVECLTCGTNIMVTTAGRPDDPRLVEIPCKHRGRAH